MRSSPGLLRSADCSCPAAQNHSLPPTATSCAWGTTFTYAAHRTLLPGQALAREYSHKAISSFPATGCTDPAEPPKNPGDPRKASEAYGRLRRGGFADWRLSIEGLVSKPGSFSLADLKRFPTRTQITRQMCEEGWSAIAEWTGAPLSRVLDAAGMLPAARYIAFHTFDGWLDCIDMLDALHPQTILAYGMNGHDLPVPHGAPVRLRVETQLGYKSMKYLERIVVRDTFEDGGPNGNIQTGWAWYAGI